MSHNTLRLSFSSTPSGWCSYPFSLLFKSYLQQSFQWTSVVMSSLLVLFLRQALALTYFMIYFFTLLATQPTQQGVHGLVYIELNLVCSQCLFLGCKYQCFSFHCQVTFPSPLPGLIFVNCLRHFPCKLTMHFFLRPSIPDGILSVLLNSFFFFFSCLTVQTFCLSDNFPSISPSTS